MTEEQNEEQSGESAAQQYEVEVDRAVTKSLRKVDGKARQRLLAAIERLATNPRPEGTKALTGPYAGSYRLRISAPGGEYRVVWTVDDKQRKVNVVDAGSREDTY